MVEPRTEDDDPLSVVLANDERSSSELVVDKSDVCAKEMVEEPSDEIRASVDDVELALDEADVPSEETVTSEVASDVGSRELLEPKLDPSLDEMDVVKSEESPGVLLEVEAELSEEGG